MPTWPRRSAVRSTTAEEKRALRAAVRAQLSALTDRERQESDEKLFRRFLSLPQVAAAETVFAFWGIPGKEPDTARLIENLLAAGKTVCLPRMLPGHRMEVRRYLPQYPMKEADFGILEPDPALCPVVEREGIDLVLVPAACYDRRGYRLGFGGGYYDRWLAEFRGVTVGLCRQAVLQELVPIEVHDSRVDVLLTEEEQIFC